ncbi:MAG: carboxypeptidase-like regulatory domain-containing protein [Bacteroidota bacterium]|nr:carboxypeptidase-like regulatory domain-containing protein [Bacteroidota bacterium]
MWRSRLTSRVSVGDGALPAFFELLRVSSALYWLRQVCVRAAMLIGAASCGWVISASAQVAITGTVRDASTRLPLASAHVIVRGTQRGTITNHEGAFEVTVPSLPAKLVFRYLGYGLSEFTIGPNDARSVSVYLEPVVYPLPELLVVGDAFAAGVMGQVIMRKAARRAHLPAYSSAGYSRITLERRDRAVLVGEYVYDRYRDPERGFRHVVRSRRATARFHTELGLTPEPQDLSQDWIAIGGLDFIGPTHPDALSHYIFTFAGRRQMGSRYVYDMYVAPRTNLEATLIGRLAVLDSAYVLLEADLKPADHVVFGADVRTWDLFYRQQFAEVDSFWLPVGLFVEGRIHVEPDGVSLAPASVRQVAQLKDYQLGVTAPDEVLARPGTWQTDTLSVLMDDLFLMGLDQVMLTPRELEAIEAARGRPELTLRQALPAAPRQRGADREAEMFAAGDPPQFVWPAFFGWEPQLRYNRVDGVLGGVGTVMELGGAGPMEVAGRIAQSLGLGRTRVEVATRHRWSSRWAFTLKLLQDLRPVQDPVIHPVALNSLSARLLRRDYFDWYWSQRAGIALQYQRQRVRLLMSSTVEGQSSVERQVRHPWPYRRSFPPNPPVADQLRVGAELRLAAGANWQPYPTTAHRRVEIRLEYGHAGSSGGYLRSLLRADAFVNTFRRSRPEPARLMLRLLTGASSGSLPIVRRHGLEGTLGPLAALGTLRSMTGRSLAGQHVGGLYWEHDFRGLLFEALGLRRWAEAGVGFRLAGAHARIWPGAGSTQEASVSLVRAPVRLDLTRRLNTPGWFVTAGFVGRR